MIMKSLKKLFAAAIASTMMISCLAINAFAQDSVATIEVDKAADLKAGDVVTVTITLDQTKGLANVKYTLEYPTDVFTIDTAGNEEKYLEYEEEYDMVPNYYDADWYYEALDNAGFLKKLNTIVSGPSIDEAENGKITLSATTVTGSVTSSKGFDVVVGQYFLKVKEGAKAGDAVLSLTGGNSDANLTVGTITCEDVTVNVAGGAPEEPETAPEYFNANFTAGGPKYNGNKGMEFFFKSAKLNKEASYIFNFDEMFKDPTFESETNVDVAIKVNDVPEDDTVTLTGYEWSELGR